MGVETPRVVVLSQQPGDGRLAHAVSCWVESIRQLTHTDSQPFAFVLRIAGGFRFDQLEQFALYLRIFFSARWRPPPGKRRRSAGRDASDWASSCRPRRIVFKSSPVISATCVSPLWPTRNDSTAAAALLFVQARHQQIHLLMQHVIRSREQLLTVQTLTLMHDGGRHACFLLFSLQLDSCILNRASTTGEIRGSKLGS